VGPGLFCIDVYSGDSSAVETDPSTGGLSLDLGADWVPAQVSIQYTCAPGSLSMQGALDGNVTWGPYGYAS
jgi:hypothetical protein